MTIPSNKELMNRYQQIVESERINESGPESDEGFKTGEAVGMLSKDNHSNAVTRKREPGAPEAVKSYDGNDKKLETDGGNKRKPGADESQDKFEGSDKSVNDKTDGERKENALGKAAVAKGAAKSFAEFKNDIRAKMGLPLDDKLNKGNDGKIH